MKRLYIITLLFVLGGLSNNANSQNFLWGKQLGGTDDDYGSPIAVDTSGNVYATGGFRGTVDFDPGTGMYNLTAIGSQDIFVSKLDASGNFIWAKQFGGTGLDNANSIAIDASTATGGIYTTGLFYGTVDFDPGIGTFNLTSAGFGDIFISKLDSAGNFLWAKQLGGTADFDYGFSLALDASGNVYTTGYFYGTADFDPGAGTYNLSSAGDRDIFVSKLDASGNFLWAKQLGGLNDDRAYSLVVDTSTATGGIYTTGFFQSIVDFDPGIGVYNLTSAGDDDIFVSKLDSSGNFVWAIQMGGAAEDRSYSIAVDASSGTGAVYNTGFFNGTVDFNPGTGTYNLVSAGLGDIFVSKLDASGNFLWAKQLGGTADDVAYSIAVNASPGTGDIYTTGFFNGTVDFNPGTGTYNLTSIGNSDVFISKIDTSGNFLWAKQIGGTSIDVGSFIVADANKNVYTTGWFYGTAEFDPGTETYNLISAGNSDIFVVKLSDVFTGITDASTSIKMPIVYPNPSNGRFNITSSAIIDEIRITNLLGQIIYQTKPSSNNFSLQQNETGIYFIHITIGKQIITKKLIVCR
jgi:hypothetical protein